MGNKFSSSTAPEPMSPEKSDTYTYNKFYSYIAPEHMSQEKKLHNEIKTLNKAKKKIRLPNKTLTSKLTPEDVRQYKISRDDLYKINQKIEKNQRELKYNSYKNKILTSNDNIILPQSNKSKDGISRRKTYRRRKSKSRRRKSKSKQKKYKLSRRK